MKQPCWVLAISSRFPHELTTLPSTSNSITGGAGVARFLSLGAGSPLVTANTWSRASTHTLPTDPSTHPSGSGLGQEASYLNCGASTAWALIWAGNQPPIPSTTVNSAATKIPWAHVLILIAHSFALVGGAFAPHFACGCNINFCTRQLDVSAA